MSRYDFKRAVLLATQDEPFYALIMAAMIRADSNNIQKLRFIFPDVWAELDARYHAPDGRIGTDDIIRCNYCGCDDDHACEGGCSWVTPGMCSSCSVK